MSNDVRGMRRQVRTGDTAADGLIAGILAGLGMGATLILTGLLDGVPAAATLGRFDPGRGGNVLAGTVAHLAVSSIYGVLFALLLAGVVRARPGLRRWGWLLGMVYGLLLYVFARGIPFATLPSGMAQFTAVQLLVAHIIYGLLLGLELRRIGA